jgi:hypothetical protein
MKAHVIDGMNFAAASAEYGPEALAIKYSPEVVLVLVIFRSLDSRRRNDTGSAPTVSHFVPAINPVSLRDSTLSLRQCDRSSRHIARD